MSTAAFSRLVKEWADSDLGADEVAARIADALITPERRTIIYLQELRDFLGTGQFPTLTRRGIPRRFFEWEPLVRRLVEKRELPASYLSTLREELGKD